MPGSAPLIVQAEPTDVATRYCSIGNMPSKLGQRFRKLGGDCCDKSARRREVAPSSREEEARAETLLVPILTGDRQRDRRLARASHALEPVYPPLGVSVSLSPDLLEDFATCVGKTEPYMLLVFRVEGCFGQAVEEVKRSFRRHVWGILWRTSAKPDEKRVGEERALALTIDDIPLMDSRIVPERVFEDRTALHITLQFTILVPTGPLPDEWRMRPVEPTEDERR